MRPQAFLDGIRSSRGMGMGNTRMRDDRSADQDQTQSGNPRTIFNQPRMVGLAQGSGFADKMPPQSFHQRPMVPGGGVRPQFGQLQSGAVPQQGQMPPQAQPMPQQQPVDPRRRFARPMFRQ